MWTLESCNPIKLPSKKKKERKKSGKLHTPELLSPSPSPSLSVVTEMNSWASDLSCTDSNYCWCCLLLTQVNRMSHENTRARAQQKGSWIRGVPGWGPCGRCVGDTKDRAGQCLNVTTLLFAVNYGWGQEYWLCNPAEQTFCCSQWRWQEKKKGSMFVPVLFVFFFSFPLIKNKIWDIPAGPEFLSRERWQKTETERTER